MIVIHFLTILKEIPKLRPTLTLGRPFNPGPWSLTFAVVVDITYTLS